MSFLCCFKLKRSREIHDKQKTTDSGHNRTKKSPIELDSRNVNENKQPRKSGSHVFPERNGEDVQQSDERKQLDVLRKKNADLQNNLIEKDDKLEQLAAQVKELKKENNSDRQNDVYSKSKQDRLYQGRGVIFDEDNREHVKKLKTTMKELNSQLAKTEATLKDLKEELRICKEERDSYIDRLSEHAANKLMDNNPHITDLSDPNRPSKLAERFAELYDNQWSDALDVLTQEGQISDEYAVKYLLDTLQIIYETCTKKATHLLEDLEKSILSCIFCNQMPEHLSTQMKIYKEERKRNYRAVLADIQNDVLVILQQTHYNTEEKQLLDYVSEATDVCWLMSIQDPPMFVDFACCKSGESLNTEILSNYTERGEAVSYLVWPVLHQYKGGPVITRGVAQCKRKIRKSNIKDNQNKDNSLSKLTFEDNGDQENQMKTPMVNSNFVNEQALQGMQHQAPAKRIRNPERLNKRSSDSNIGTQNITGDLSIRSVDETQHHREQSPVPQARQSWIGSPENSTYTQIKKNNSRLAPLLADNDNLETVSESGYVFRRRPRFVIHPITNL